MKEKLLAVSILLLMALLSAGCDKTPDQRASAPAAPAQTASPAAPAGEAARDEKDRADKVTEIEWDDLIPADWQPEELIAKYNASALSDDDPRAKEAMEKIKRLWTEAPVVHDYDGKTIRLAGFVVPLEMDTENIRELLLVPYYGACIHVPPPPANQTAYVVAEEGKAYKGELFDTVWVTGTLTVDKSSSDLGSAAYRIDAVKFEPYEW
jgi:hypothetical protein